MSDPPAPTPVAASPLLRAILTSRVYDVAVETPLEPASRLSARLGHQVLLKREDMQPVFSFKLRGAYNRMAHLDAGERARGVVAASAGNHAQGVAYAARHLGVSAAIVMPVTTPAIKVRAVRDLGAEVVLHGDSYADAEGRCRALAEASGRVVIHPFDDPLVIAGQGTVALEVLRHRLGGRADAIFVPVGGGGLVAGIGAYVKALRPEIAVVGVEPVEADAMARSLAGGERVVLDQVGLFADGVAVRQVGVHTFAVARHVVDEVVTVSTDEICAAIKDVFDDTRSILEPSGALAVAGLRRWSAGRAPGHTLVAVLSGANMNFDRLRFVAERAEVGEARETVLAVTIPERPGAFREFCTHIGRRVVTEFNYRLSGRDAAHIFVGVAVDSRPDGDALQLALASAGYETHELTDNEAAKLHVRHMVGGRSAQVTHERVRFAFPERPGALMRFLDAVGGRWNISLFHYRNHGADPGRVLAGFEVPPEDMPAFERFLVDLGYPAERETDNPAYRLFLR
ncbi:MAG: threonine ammonia-lyase, biosynthetic [Vicinamibacterales bacterium]